MKHIHSDFLNSNLRFIMKTRLKMCSSAQCYPRLACPLYGSVLMQVHDHAGGAPALAALTRDRKGKRMQFDAVMHAGLKMAENTERTHKKTGIQGAGLSRVYCGNWPRNTPIILVRQLLATISKKTSSTDFHKREITY